MEYIHVIMAGLTAIILFVFGLENFSAEIEQISGERFRKFLARATRIPTLGVLIGETRGPHRKSTALRRPGLLWQINDFEHRGQRPVPT